MAIYEFEGKAPVISENNTYIHPEAVIIGDVVIGDNCFVGPCAVLRGDYGQIIIGNGSNIQDGVIIHTEPGSQAVLGENSHIGHGSMLHGPLKFGDNVMVGICAVVLNGAEVEDGAVIGACSLLTNNTRVAARKVMMGSPAREVKDVPEQMAIYTGLAVKVYQDLALRSRTAMKRIG